MSLSRPTARSSTTKFGCAAAICLGLLGLSATSAAASSAACEGQAFSQPFITHNDTNYYTLVPGSEFNGSEAGWELSKGAHVVTTVRPDGSTAQVLDMPSGAVAVSPSICVTLEYPTARTWVRNVKGAEGIYVGVAYAKTSTATNPKNVGQIHGQHNEWTLSDMINLQPQTAGPAEETRQLRLVFTSGGTTSDFQIVSLWVDPRMR